MLFVVYHSCMFNIATLLLKTYQLQRVSCYCLKQFVFMLTMLLNLRLGWSPRSLVLSGPILFEDMAKKPNVGMGIVIISQC